MVKDAYKLAIPPLAAGALCLIPGWNWPAGILIFLGLFIFYFFRDPNRVVPPSPGLVVAPADGRVVEVIEEAFEGRPGHRISIFLSIWNVHVQRAPVAGRICKVDYRRGRFYGAYRSAASAENEQNVIYIDTPKASIIVKQIAGAIARRVICWKHEGDEVAIGERIGMIRFGSRVDLWLPIEAEILVRRGQFAKGGETIFAKWISIA